MKSKINNLFSILKKFHPIELYCLFKNFSQLSYSQEGEDLLINELLPYIDKGSYLDIGAHHPVRFSNTYALYKRGWSGLCIDAFPDRSNEYKFFRPRDTYLQLGVGVKGKKKMWIYNDPALNTFSSDQVNELKAKHGITSVSSTFIQCKLLSEILRDNHHRFPRFDVLNIDIEGFDEKIIFDFPWDYYQPKIVLTEAVTETITDLPQSKTFNFLKRKGYLLKAKSIRTCIYQFTQ